MSIRHVASSPKPAVSPWPDAQRPLPPFVRDYIDSGAAEGQRNDTIHKAAQQFLACGYSASEAESWLLPRALADGVSERETRQTIGSAYKSSKVTEPITVGGGGGSSKATASKAAKLGFIEALRAAFLPGESIAVVESRLNGAGEWKPSVATIKTLEDWAKWYARMGDINRLFGSSAGGAFIGINPVKAGSQSRSNDNVSMFRHVLVEWDKDQSLAEQAARIEASGLPVSVMLTSGGKSVHAWVRVDAKDHDEWNARRDFLFEKLECDPKNKDLARVSRCPGAMRGEYEQKVLAINLGPKSWADYEQRNEWVPETTGIFSLVERGPEPPPEIIIGLLRQSCVMQISSGPKMRKSFLLLDLALSIEGGLPWLGFETVAGPVFYLDAENHASLIRARLPMVADSRGVKITKAHEDRIVFCPLRGKLRGKTLPELVAGIVRAIRKMPVPPVLAILEPLYLLLRGAKEKEAEEVTLALEELNEVCSEIGCAIVFVHHFSKGNQKGKASMDRASGSGALSRFPDAIVTLTAPDEPKDYAATVESDVRWFAPRRAFNVWWHKGHYDTKPSTTFKLVQKYRHGSYADKYATIVATMPPLRRHHNDMHQCAASAWLAMALKVDLKEARNTLESLRQEEYNILSAMGGNMFCGVDYEPESMPQAEDVTPEIEGESVNNDIPF